MKKRKAAIIEIRMFEGEINPVFGFVPNNYNDSDKPIFSSLFETGHKNKAIDELIARLEDLKT